MGFTKLDSFRPVTVYTHEEQAKATMGIGSVHIRLLGAFAVSVEGAQVPDDAWRLRKARSLVKLLALDPRHRLHWEQIGEALWPDRDAAAVRNNIHQVLRAARDAFGTLGVDGHDVLRLRDGIVSFRDDVAVSVDVEEFTAAAEHALNSASLEAYRAAAALYTGELLPEDRYDDTLDAPREALREQHSSLLLEMARLHLGRGEQEAAIDVLRTLLLHHELHEPARRELMQVLAESGRRQEALREFESLRDALRRTLEADPDPETRRLYRRLLAGSLEDDGPVTLETEDHPTDNLPAAVSSFIGRDRELGEVERLLSRTRLLTLTGVGGAGKTRLAIEVARRQVDAFEHGVWLTDLAPASDPEQVPLAVAEVLGLDLPERGPFVPALVDQLADRRLLLLLDNCEHLVDACASLVQELLQRCPELHVLTTSRQTLDLDGEVAWRVPSLSLPPVGADLAHLAVSDAARLFVTRAASVRPGFTAAEDDAAAIAAICRELDGIPLAIELAAARLRVLSPQEIADRLDDRFAMLRTSRRGAPSRHRTLDAAIAWSYELLGPAAQRLLLRLAVFEGSFTVAAAETTCSGDELPRGEVLELLDDLVGRSLVSTTAVSVGPARHELLQSIRSFARARWSDRERTEISRRHAGWCASLGDAAATELTGPDQVRWLNELHAEHADLRTALRWSSTNARFDLALRITAGVWWFWLQFGHAREGAAWLAEVLAAVDAAPATAADVDPDVLVRATYAAGRLAGAAGEDAAAQTWLERAAELAVREGSTGWAALSLARLGQQRQVGGASAAAAAALEDARRTADGHDDPWVHAGISDVAGHLAVAAGDLERAGAAFEVGEQRYLEAQDRWSACLARLGRAWVARRSGQLDHALSLHAENLRSTRTLTRSAFDFVGIARDLRGVAAVASRVGHHALAAQLCGASETLRTLGEVALTSDERHEVDAVIRAATERIGADAVNAEQAIGRSLGASEALTVALQATGELMEPVDAFQRAGAEAGT